MLVSLGGEKGQASLDKDIAYRGYYQGGDRCNENDVQKVVEYIQARLGP